MCHSGKSIIISVCDLQKGEHSAIWQNWDCKCHERRDYFDCEKILVLLGMKRFRAGSSDSSPARPNRRPTTKRAPKNDCRIGKPGGFAGNWGEQNHETQETLE